METPKPGEPPKNPLDLRFVESLRNDPFFQTIALRIKEAKRVASERGGNWRDYMDDPTVIQIKVTKEGLGSKVTFGFDTLLRMADITPSPQSGEKVPNKP